MKIPKALVALFATSSLSSAAVLVQYEFNDNAAERNLLSGALAPSGGRVTYNATTSDAGVVASVFEGDGLELFTNNALGLAFTSTAGGGAIAANTGDTIGFTLSAVAGNTLDLNNITFTLNASSTATSFSLDAIADGGSAVELQSTTQDDGAFDLDLTSFADDVETIEFIIALDNIPGGNNNIQIDDVTVNGSVVPVPEPSSTILAGLGGLALILRRRK